MRLLVSALAMAALALPAEAGAQPVWTAAQMERRVGPADPLVGVEQLAVWPEGAVYGGDVVGLDDASDGATGPSYPPPRAPCLVRLSSSEMLESSLIHRSGAAEHVGLAVFGGRIRGFQSEAGCLSNVPLLPGIPADTFGTEFTDSDYAFSFTSGRALLVQLHADGDDPVDEIRVLHELVAPTPNTDLGLRCGRREGVDSIFFEVSLGSGETADHGGVSLTVWAPWAPPGCFESLPVPCEADTQRLGAFSCEIMGLEPTAPVVSQLVPCAPPADETTVAFVVPEIHDHNYENNDCVIEAETVPMPDAGAASDSGSGPPPRISSYRGSTGCECRASRPGPGGATGWLPTAALCSVLIARRRRR